MILQITASMSLAVLMFLVSTVLAEELNGHVVGISDRNPTGKSETAC